MFAKRPDPEDKKATLYSLSSLSSGELLQQLEGLVRRQDELTAQVLAHVGEVDARKLYLGVACSSMFAYCTDVLHLPRGATYKRIHAARAARKHPVIYELVAAGRLHLSSVCLLAPHLSADNGEELLEEAAGCTKRQVEKLLVRWFPKPDVETTVRALPLPRGAGPLRPDSASRELSLLSEPSQSATRLEPGGGDADKSTAAVGGSPAFGEGPPASGGECSGASAPVSAPAARRRRDELTPLSARRYKIQLTAGQSLHDKLKQAQQLLGGRVAPGDLAAVFEQGLDLLIRDLRRKRFAETDRPNRPTKRKRPPQGSASKPAGDEAVARPEPGAVAAAPSPPEPSSPSRSGGAAAKESPKDRGGRAPRYIPAEVRRTVARRDSYQCTFVDPDSGRRCPERSNLQYHHEHPWARGGSHEASNIFLACGAHNRYLAEQDYGAEHIARRVEQARQARGAGTAAAVPPDDDDNLDLGPLRDALAPAKTAAGGAGARPGCSPSGQAPRLEQLSLLRAP